MPVLKFRNGQQPGVTAQRRRTPAEIEQIAAAFAGSGLTRTEFCRREHLGLGTLNRYLQRQHPDVASGPADGRLREVPLVRPDSSFSYFIPPLPSSENTITVTAQNTRSDADAHLSASLCLL